MHKITINGKTQNLAEWCRELGLPYDTIRARINRYKWPIEQALGLSPPPQKKQKSVINRIFDKLKRNPKTFCWEWIGCLNHDGYGIININHKNRRIHRIMYKYIYSTIPEEKPYVLHRCDNRKCCNPTHLYAGTHQNNSDDRENRNRGNHPMGENCSCVKLTEKQVLEIRASDDPNAVLAKRYNVTIGSIYHIKNRIAWKHLK